MFYIDDAFIASRNPDLLQEAMDILVSLFDRVGLRTNTKKTKVQIFVPGRIRTRMTDSAYTRSRISLEERGRWEGRNVECQKCGMEMRASSLKGHLASRHGVYRTEEFPPELTTLARRPTGGFAARCPAA